MYESTLKCALVHFCQTPLAAQTLLQKSTMDPSQSTAILRLLPQPRPLFDDFFLSTARRQTEQGKDMGMGPQPMSSAGRQRWTEHLRGQPWLSRQNAAALLDLRMMPSPKISARAEPETSWRYMFFR